MDIDLKDKRCSHCLGIPFEWFRWRGRSSVVFGSFLSQSLPRLDGRWLWVFSAELLPRGLAAVAQPSLLLLLTISKLLLARAAIVLGLFNTHPLLGETLTICVGASGENWAPTSSLPLEGAPASCLLESWLLLPLLGHCMGHVRAWGKPKHHTPSRSLSLWGHHYPLRRLRSFFVCPLKLLEPTVHPGTVGESLQPLCHNMSHQGPLLVEVVTMPKGKSAWCAGKRLLMGFLFVFFCYCCCCYLSMYIYLSKELLLFFSISLPESPVI